MSVPPNLHLPNKNKLKKKWKLGYLVWFILIVAVLFTGSLIGYQNWFKNLKSAKAIEFNPDKILSAVNLERKKQGLTELSFNAQVQAAAELKAQDMLTLQYFDHRNPVSGKRGISHLLDVNYEYQIAGENLAIYFDNVEEMVSSWMLSPSHQANILHPDFSESGVGLAFGNFDGFETFLVVQIFSKPFLTVTDLKSADNQSEPKKNLEKPETKSEVKLEETKEDQAINQTPVQPTEKINHELEQINLENAQKQQLFDETFKQISSSNQTVINYLTLRQKNE